jgi:hypothetical protein
MELASMLAGEDFTDHPQAACPVIGAFLRAYNDCIDDAERQDLYAYAAKVVGTRSTFEVECPRAELCREAVQRIKAAGGDCAQASSWPRLPGWLRRWGRRAGREFVGRRAGLTFGQAEVDYGGVLKPDNGRHRAALRLVDELIGVGGSNPVEPPDLHLLASEGSVSAEVLGPPLISEP